jgi:hypothetical protein
MKPASVPNPPRETLLDLRPTGYLKKWSMFALNLDSFSGVVAKGPEPLSFDAPVMSHSVVGLELYRPVK